MRPFIIAAWVGAVALGLSSHAAACGTPADTDLVSSHLQRGYIGNETGNEEQVRGDHDVTITRTVHASAERVWATLTEPELVAKWMMGARVNSTWKPGDPITWSGDYDGKAFEDSGTVVEAERPERLVHTHRSGSAGADAAEHELTWSITATDGDATELALTQTGATSAQEAEQFRQGWSMMLDQLRDTAQG
jgi:uncharacterized protein YndB with AHSA1/START domain